ncbi:hypothetical protein ONS96_014733 [Cadophora gregata f. sp. sojae]|nr:hypothetical protein ONS96_014733 [Cadophora gregata f. sp. sojae]
MRIGKARECFERPPVEEQVQRRIKLMKTIPRYKAFMFSSLEHYAVGHDDMLEIFDESLDTMNPDDPQRSFLFAGIGDARHLYRMFWDIYAYEERGSPRKNYHWSVIDINKYALARDLIIFMLLNDLSIQDSFESDEAMLILTTIYYIFAGSMMPLYTFDKMQQTISRALAAVRSGQPPLDWVYLHQQDVASYIQVFTEWQDKAMRYIRNDQFLLGLVKIQRENEATQHMYLTRTPKTFRHEQVLYTRSGLLYPPRTMLKTRELTLCELIDKYPKLPKKNASFFREYISKNWKINPSLIALDWIEYGKEEIDLNHDPFLLQGQITTETRPRDLPDDLADIWNPPVAPGVTSLFDQISPFFTSVAKAIKALNSRIQVEVILGDFIDTTELMRHGLYRSDKTPASDGDDRWPRPEGFPCLFDRIHSSNIPDYNGGHLSSFLFAIPLLKRVITSRAMSNCLRNSPRWSSMDDFVAHYQCIPDEDTLKKLTQTDIILGDVGPYPLAEYAYYFPSDVSSPSWKQDYGSLLDRKSFTK